MSDAKIKILENHKKESFSFDTNSINEIIDFIEESKYNIIHQTGCLKSDVLVCVPRFILDYLAIANGLTCNALFSSYFTGIKCQISYENSITVFYNHLIPNRIIKYTKSL